MTYTRDYILEKITNRLPGIKIYERKKEDSSIFILDYNGNKAKIDIDSFSKRLGEKRSEKSDKKLEEFIYHIGEQFEVQSKFNISGLGNAEFIENVYPVIRSSGFDKENKAGLVKFYHTNETNTYLAYDIGNSYKLISEKILTEKKIKKEELYQKAISNLEKLPLNYKKDEVAGNVFYFLNTKDGYDGARILDKKVLDYFYKKIGSDYYVGLPHQDVLIVADIKNKQGLEILQKMMVHFFTEGIVPITTITFKYDGENLDSLFIFVE